MWRKVMCTPTEDTRVDIVPPVFDGEAHDEPLPSLVPADEEEDDETRLLSRLSWPEPPRSLSERPRQGDARPAQLSRSVGGISHSVFTSSGGKTPTFWCGLAAAVLVAACLSVVLTRTRSQPSATLDVNARVPAAGPVGAPGATHPTLPSPVSNRAPVAVPTKPPIDVTMLPLAPRAPPTNRFRRPSSMPSGRTKTQAKVATPSAPAPQTTQPTPVVDTVIDDGF
jgi:hypothetical protein